MAAVDASISENIIPLPGARKARRRCASLRPFDDAPENVVRFLEARAHREHARRVEQVKEAGVRRTPELLILLAVFEQLDHDQRRAAHSRIASFCSDPASGDLALAALALLGR